MVNAHGVIGLNFHLRAIVSTDLRSVESPVRPSPDSSVLGMVYFTLVLLTHDRRCRYFASLTRTALVPSQPWNLRGGYGSWESGTISPKETFRGARTEQSAIRRLQDYFRV